MLSKCMGIFIICLLTGCTATLNLVNAGGQAKDVVDDTLEQSADVKTPIPM